MVQTKLPATILHDQAFLFGTYLLKQPPAEAAVALYARAMNNDAGVADAQDEILLAYVLRHPKALRYIDAALALRKPQSEIRRRLYVMFSILEATPDHHQKFLPQQRSMFYVVVVLAAGLQAVFSTIVGILLLKVVAR